MAVARAAAAVAALLCASGCAVERERTPREHDASRIHEAGILDPGDPDFHGTLLEESGWDFALCARCHGDDFEGGSADAPCTSCHAGGPTSCATCHASIFESGSHAAHISSETLEADACAGCHAVPERWDAPGHVLRANGEIDRAPAEVALSGLAAFVQEGGVDLGAPSFAPEPGTCSAVYCHGATLGDAAALNVTPNWRRPGEGEAACGTCHGTPPADHGSARCVACHARVAGEDLAIVDASLHLDGEVDLGRGTGDCTACHGSAGSPAPPRDLFGGVSTDRIGVGAHEAHVYGPHRLASPIACVECHLVPETIDAPGHLDSELPAEVFASGGGALASAMGATPVWSSATATCADVYCHGGGPVFAGDASPSRVPEPVWTDVGSGQAACGACHGAPPLDAVHDPAQTLRDCATCHASVDGFGNILFDGGRSEHLDGDVDVR